MLKIIIATLLSIFILVSAMVVFYWRDVKYEPSGLDFLIYFGGIPVALTLLVLSPLLIQKWLKIRQERKQQQESAAQNDPYEPASTTAKVAELEWTQLNIFASSSLSAMGEDEQHLQALQDYQSPELDRQLLNGYGLPMLSYRIAEIDDLADQQETSDLRQSRIMALIQQQLEKNTEALWHIAAHLKQSALFYDSQLAQVYRMHPAWIDPAAESFDQPESEITPEPVSRLNHMNVHIILPENLLHLWDEGFSSQQLQDYLLELGIFEPQIHIEYHYWGTETAYWQWLDLLKQTQQQTAEVSLMLCVDSEIDQELIDEKVWANQNYLPAEFIASCILATPAVEIQQLAPSKSIRIASNSPQIAEALSWLQLNELTQYEEEVPFVLVLDQPTDIKRLKKLEQNFSQSPIEAHHYLFSQAGVGHTQHVSKIFGFMLGMSLPEDSVAMVYTAEHAQTQVFIGAEFAK